MKRHLLIAALLLLGAAPVATLAGAQERGPSQGAAACSAGSQAPLSRVLAMIAKRYPGRQLNTTMGESGGRPAYLIQWQLTNGQIVVFTVDACTGQLVG
ncbi:PepSY domain-containing protein [Phenylobacterium sp.]|uniref:PepSY domain-containing protein n=1 Tax=Phenylobacterium sp. TaxID=1871053 RepID=UPI003569D4DE